MTFDTLVLNTILIINYIQVSKLKSNHTIIQSMLRMIKIFLIGIKMTIVRKIAVIQIYVVQQMNTNTLWTTFVRVSPTSINITNSNIAHFITPFIMTRVNNASHYT